MSVWLTPELKPFYGGTYFPPSSRWDRPGLRRDPGARSRGSGETSGRRCCESAEAVTEQLRGSRAGRGAAAADTRRATRSTRTGEQFKAGRSTRATAGSATRPSSPAGELLFLLREHARTGDGEARDMALATLRAMALGGMRDHVGGGFHRYSVDAAWRVPHFEKMLYDQAQLVLALVEGAQASGDQLFLEWPRTRCGTCMREMTDAGGGFYSAEDADSVPPEQAHDPGAAQVRRRLLPVARRRARRAARRRTRPS